MPSRAARPAARPAASRQRNTPDQVHQPGHRITRKPGRPIGTGHYPYREDQEREEILRLMDKGTRNEDIAILVGWPENEIRDLRARFFPTAGLATRYLKANALKMAMRVVEESNVEEAVDILSRPNIGVLAPAAKNAPQNIGIFTSIQMDSLGGVHARDPLLIESTAVSAVESSAAPAIVTEGQPAVQSLTLGETRPVAAPLILPARHAMKHASRQPTPRQHTRVKQPTSPRR